MGAGSATITGQVSDEPVQASNPPGSVLCTGTQGCPVTNFIVNSIGTVVPPPQITSITPTYGTVGTSGTITVNGSNLIDQTAQGVAANFSDAGVIVTIQSKSATQVVLAYTIPTSVGVGEQNLSLTNQYGTSNTVQFNIGDPTPNITSISNTTWNAGQTTPISIYGTGFGTNPTVSVTGAGVSVSGVVPVSPTQINANITVAAPPPNETATLTVTSNGYNGQGFVATQQGELNNNSYNVTVVAIPAPAARIIFGATDITGVQHEPVTTGQQIKLDKSVSFPSGLVITSEVWTPQGTAVGGYNHSQNSGQVQALTLTASPVTFYWVYVGTSVSVTYSYCLNNGQCSPNSQAGFDITGHSASFSIIHDIPRISTIIINSVSTKILSFGNLSGTFPDHLTGTPGIQFTASPNPANGSYSWEQLIVTDRIQSTSSSGVTTCDLGHGLDNTDPYRPLTSTYTNDSPFSTLLSSNTEVTRNFSAQMYLLWTPNLTGAIPVPIGSVSWSFYGDATNGSHGWSLRSGTDNVGQFVAAQPTNPFHGYPTWSGHTTNSSCGHGLVVTE